MKDFSSFSPGTVTEYSTLVCLACIFDIFTAQLGLAPRTAYSEIKRYSPSVAELTAPEAIRPFFDSGEKNLRCPYCNAAKKWHARLDTFRIEGGKATDSLRRSLLKSLPKKDDAVLVIETKSQKARVFFDWLAPLNGQLDFTSDHWLIEATRAFVERLEPKQIGRDVHGDTIGSSIEQTGVGLAARRCTAVFSTRHLQLKLARAVFGQPIAHTRAAELSPEG